MVGELEGQFDGRGNGGNKNGFDLCNANLLGVSHNKLLHLVFVGDLDVVGHGGYLVLVTF